MLLFLYIPLLYIARNVYSIKSDLFAPTFFSNTLEPSEATPKSCQSLPEDFICIANKTRPVGKVLQNVTGGHETCFLTTLKVQNQSYLVQIDSGSSDTSLPHSTINNYKGPYIDYSIPAGKETSQKNAYGDGSWWKGYIAWLDVGFGSTSISAKGPVGLMTSQSTKPIFASGLHFHGLFGIAFPALSAINESPATIIDAWYESNAISKNEIAFHGCSLRDSLLESPYLDIGNETPYKACGGIGVSIQIPNPSFYNVHILGISLNGTPQALPTAFQSRYDSILDSCTANILLPTLVYQSLIDSMHSSGAFSRNLTSSIYFSAWLAGNYILHLKEADIDWSRLPTLSFTVSSGMTVYNNVTLAIGPRQYIQQTRLDGYWAFMVDSLGSNNLAVLGFPLFTAFHIILDRTNSQITFMPGCGCEYQQDKYPLIYTDNFMNRCLKVEVPKSNESTEVQSYSWSCQTLPNLEQAVAIVNYQSSSPFNCVSANLLAVLLFVVFK